MRTFLAFLVFAATLAAQSERPAVCPVPDTGGDDAYVGTCATGTTRVKLIVNTANTGAATLDIGGGAVAIYCSGTSNCADGTIAAGRPLELVLESAVWQVLGAVTGGSGSVTPGDNLRDRSGTTDWDPTDVSTVWYRTDFSRGTMATTSVLDADIQWGIANNGGSPIAPAFQTSAFPNLGVLRFASSSTAAGNGFGIAPKGQSLIAYSAMGNVLAARWVFVWRNNESTNQRFHIGLLSAANNVATNGVGVRHDTNAAAKCGAADTTNYSFFSYNSGSSSDGCSDTGVAVTTGAGAFQTLVIRTDGATANKYYMTFNGGSEVTVCASGGGCTFSATPTTLALGPTVLIYADDSGGNKVASFDMNHFSHIARVSTNKNDRNP